MKRSFFSAALAAILLSGLLSGCGTIASAAIAPGEVDEFHTGTIDGDTYENTFFGIGCKLDDDWTILDEEELAERSGLVFDTLEEGGMDDSARTAMENGSVVFDFFAQKLDNSAAVNVTVGNIGVLYGTSLTEEAYIDLAYDEVIQSVEAIGYDNVTAEKTTVTFAGTDHAAMNVYGEYSGVPVYQVQIALRKGLYVGTVTLSSGGEDTTSDLAALFYALD